MTVRCISVDDEQYSLAKVNDFVSKLPYLKLLASFSSAIEAMGFLRENKVDLIFLDIEMAKICRGREPKRLC